MSIEIRVSEDHAQLVRIGGVFKGATLLPGAMFRFDPATPVVVRLKEIRKQGRPMKKVVENV